VKEWGAARTASRARRSTGLHPPGVKAKKPAAESANPTRPPLTHAATVRRRTAASPYDLGYVGGTPAPPGE
jgi:hypothetical protein